MDPKYMGQPEVHPGLALEAKEVCSPDMAGS